MDEHKHEGEEPTGEPEVTQEGAPLDPNTSRVVGTVAIESAASVEDSITGGPNHGDEHEDTEEQRIRAGFEKAFTSPRDFREVIEDDDLHDIHKPLQVLAGIWYEKYQRDELDDEWRNHTQQLYDELKDLATGADNKVASLDAKYTELRSALSSLASAIESDYWDGVPGWRNKYKDLRAEIDAELTQLQHDIDPLDRTVDQQQVAVHGFEEKLQGINEAEHNYIGAMENEEVMKGLIQWAHQHKGADPGILSSRVVEEIDAKHGVARRWRLEEMRLTVDRTRVVAQSLSSLISSHQQYAAYIDDMDRMFAANHWNAAEVYDVAARAPQLGDVRGSTLQLKNAVQSPAYATIS